MKVRESVAFVTGANRGIGLAFVRALLQAGARKLEVLDGIFTLSQEDPATFHKLWIQPLLAAGLDFKATFAHIVDSHLRPN